MRIRRVVLATVVAIVGALVPAAAMAQAAPSLSVTPQRLGPGERFAVKVTCPVAPEVSIVETDVAMVFDGTSGTTQAGTSTIEGTAGQFDTTVYASCGGVDLAPVVIDVENPLVGTFPPGQDLPPGQAEGSLFGTDCPAGTQVSVRISGWSFGKPSEGGEGYVETLPIDEHGDWVLPPVAVTMWAVVPPPGTPEGTSLRELRFDASCGDVVYPRVTEVIQAATGDDPALPPPAAPPDPDTPAPPLLPVPSIERPGGAAPAVPRPGSPGYTG